MTTSLDSNRTTPPTIVLVHGALTDASVWHAVTSELRRDGFTVFCPALPLRGLTSEAEYLASVLESFSGPLALVGHSYGGSVISSPLLSRRNLSALVYVAAFAPEAGESAGELNGRIPGSLLGPDTIDVRPYPGGQDIYLRPDRFREVYAHDLDEEKASTMAAAQRPIDAKALAESFDKAPLWKRIPSWFLVATEDRSLPPDIQRQMAQRAKAEWQEVLASHAVPVSQPLLTAQLIAAAALATAQHPLVR